MSVLALSFLSSAGKALAQPLPLKIAPPILLKEFVGAPPAGLLHSSSSLGDRLFFAANDGKTGLEPWVSDGTAQGTKLLRDLVPGSFDRLPKGSDPEFLGSTGQRIFFKTQPVQAGPFSLWSSDGTTAGTRSLAALSPQFRAALSRVPFYRPQSHAILNNRFLIAITHPDGAQLWQSDGNTQTDRLLQLKTIQPGAGIEPSFFTTAGSQTFFTAGTSNATSQLWRTDGTIKGTIALRPLNPASEFFTPWQNRVFLEAEQPQQGFEFWISDGTVKGTTLLKDIYPGPDSSGPRLLTGIGKTMYALANSAEGFELWASDGDPATTRRIKRLSNQRSGRGERQFIVHQGKLYFSFVAPAPVVGGGMPRDRWELWMSDGSEAGTRQLKTFDNGNLQNFVSFQNRIFFSANGAAGQELWSSDGTPNGTQQVADLYPGTTQIVPPCLPPGPFNSPPCPPPSTVQNGAHPRSLQVLGNHLYFIAYYGPDNPALNTIGYGQALFATDGKTIQKLQTVDQTGYFSQLLRLNDRLFFSSYDAKRDRHQLWTLR